jgi:hypothetical protein
VLAIFATSSCKKDDSTPTVLVEDGVYVVGAGTPLPALDPKGLMAVGINEVGQAPRTGMYELFMTVKSGADGFNIVEKAGAVETTYGPLSVSTVAMDGTNDQPKDVSIQIGTFTETTTKFTVPTSGLYHIVIDKRRGVVAIIPIDHWAVIGAATELGWGGETALPLKGTFNFASNMVEYEATSLKMDKGEFKFRYDNGWKVALSGDTVKVNTNLGGASIDALTPGGNNINFSGTDRGIYTINVKWTLAAGIVVTLTKTGTIAATDYSAVKLGIIGNCYYLEDGTTLATWNKNWGATTADALAKTYLPVVTNTTTYTWTWDHVVLVAPASDMEFKFRQDESWSLKSVGYGAVTMAGAAAGNFADKGGNFKCTVAGDYMFILVINAVTEDYTLTVTKY